MSRLWLCLLLAGCAPALPPPGPLVVPVYDPVYIPEPSEKPTTATVRIRDPNGNIYEGEIVVD